MPRLRGFALLLTLALLLAAGAAVAAGDDDEEGIPQPQHASRYPAHEHHPNEGVTVAADPFDTARKNSEFRTPFLKQRVLPVRLVISNDGEEAVLLDELRVQLVSPGRFKSEPLDEEDLMRRFARSVRSPDRSPRSRLPLPVPQRPRGRVPNPVIEELEELRFLARAVEPRGTQAGFFFFDIGDEREPLRGAHLYVTGLSTSNGQELFYFEVPLDKYLKAAPR